MAIRKILPTEACSRCAPELFSFETTDQITQPACFTLQSPSFDRYDVNVLVSNYATGGPVIFEDMPTYQNLHGRIEHIARMGTLTTHFTLIKPGALHLANGGYLIIDARRLLMQPYAYEGLKRSLRSGEIRIDPIERCWGL